MILFTDLLARAEIDLKRTRFVRHQSTRAPTGKTPYDLWRSNDGRFETYQRIQGKEVFKNSDWIASFVATPLNETLFVGIYKVQGIGKVPSGLRDPIAGHKVTGLNYYNLQVSEILREYRGRILIDWGPGSRAWVQHADRQNKPIIEIRQTAIEPPFPGFNAFSWPILELSSVPSSWRTALAAVSGVYLLSCRTTGKQYVGCAYGEGGFWSRWENYFQTGHGGNEGMKLAAGNDYQVSILEYASSTLSIDEIVRLEARWKDKLLSRDFGLNRN